MIYLPAGCKPLYPINFEITEMTQEMLDWFRTIHGQVTGSTEYDNLGKEKLLHYVQYGKGKRSYYRKDGTGKIRINFHSDDAEAAYMFLLKFSELIDSHNIKEANDRRVKEEHHGHY
jgi:hypothetical protein